MKKSTITLIAVSSIAAIIFIALFVWWFAPVSLLKDVDAASVSQIRVFNGSTGEEFYIDDAYNIGEIVTDIKNAKLYKTGLSGNYDGNKFYLYFYDGDKVIDELIINGAGTIRKDPFFYEDREESLPFDLLENYEKQAFTEGRVLIGDSGAYLLIVGEEPIVMHDASDGKTLFDGLDTGDLVKVRCGAIMESYPAQTHVSYVEKLADGSIDDIPDSVIDSLTELGWVT